MAWEGRVVVVVQPQVAASEAPGRYFAEILPLGLGAYGDTQEQALESITAMFASAVQARRQLGRLAAWLDRSGLEWYWETDGPTGLGIVNADRKASGRADGFHALPMAAYYPTC